MAKKKTQSVVVKLDLGCGSNKKDGFLGVDSIEFPGVDVVCNLIEPVYKPLPAGNEHLAELFERKIVSYKKWPWKDGTVAEVHASHFIEHLTSEERIHFVNELYRVLIPGGKATIITPHWASCRAYGDPTHRFGPVSEFWFYYLSKEWRLGNKDIPANAPHTDVKYLKNGFACDFEATWGYGLHPTVQLRNQESQQFMVQFYKEAVQDMIATLTKK